MGSTSEFKALADTALFKPLQLGAITLSHRVVLSPLTRMRAVKESEGVFVPGDLAVEYYSQRATKGGFLLTEATPISRIAAGYGGVPGIFTESQIAGWKKVTTAVHAKGAFIFLQLWHVGRASTTGLIGTQPVSSSEIPIEGPGPDGTPYSDSPPRQITVAEIQELVQEYAAAAKRGISAGFDGIEIHSGNGYLLDQFLHENTNTRTDAYGGDIAGRSKLTFEVLEAVTAAVGAERVGLRLSPFNYYQDTRDTDPMTHWTYVSEKLAGLPAASRPAYVNMIEPRFDEVLSETAKMESLGKNTASKASSYSCTPFRRILQPAGIKFITSGNWNRDNAVPALDADEQDAVIFGRWFIANPDLPRRLAEGLPLNAYDRSSFYGADPPSKGYVDYPFYS